MHKAGNAVLYASNKAKAGKPEILKIITEKNKNNKKYEFWN